MPDLVLRVSQYEQLVYIPWLVVAGLVATGRRLLLLLAQGVYHR